MRVLDHAGVAAWVGTGPAVLPMTWLGWGSALILLATILYQVAAHVSAGSNGGVSRWLYIGQLLASTGFLIYSISIESWVFAVTNMLLINAAALGIVVHIGHARRAAKRRPEAHAHGQLGSGASRRIQR